MKKKVLELAMITAVILSLLSACGGGEETPVSDPGNTGGSPSAGNSAELSVTGNGKVFSIEELNTEIKVPGSSKIQKVEYEIIKQSDSTSMGLRSATKSDLLQKTDILDLRFTLTGDEEDDSEVVTIDMGIILDTITEEFGGRYIIGMESGAQWIPLNYIYTRDDGITGNLKVNKDNNRVKLAIFKETNYIKNNGSVSFTQLINFWNMPDFTGFIACVDNVKAIIYKQVHTGIFQNITAYGYYSNGKITYYEYGVEQTIEIEDFIEATGEAEAKINVKINDDTTLELENSGTSEYEITIENEEPLEGMLYISKEGGNLLVEPIAGRKKINLTLPSSILNYHINCPGYYPHTGPLRWYSDKYMKPSVKLMKWEDETKVHEDDENLVTLFEIDDPADAADGVAGPGYYKYPLRDILNQESFDIEKFAIKEGENVYQLEVTLTKAIQLQWAHGFDIYLQFKKNNGESSLFTETMTGRNVNIEDGWDKLIYFSLLQNRGINSYYTAGQNPDMKDHIIIPYLKEVTGNLVKVTLPKSQLSGKDLRADLKGLQLFITGTESPENMDREMTLCRTAYVPGGGYENEWWFSVDLDKFYEIHPDEIPEVEGYNNTHYDALRYGYVVNKELLWHTYEEGVYTTYRPNVLDILNGADYEGGTVENSDMDSFSYDGHGTIRMINFAPLN